MKMRPFDEHITLECGSGGAASRALVEELIHPYFKNPHFLTLTDSGSFFPEPDGSGRLFMTTDTYIVDPPFFSGGDIGRLSIFGTCNDLSVSGARPMVLSVGFVVEEGFLTDDLKRILSSMAEAVKEAEVSIITGDTKVAPRGKGGGIYINTCGIGGAVAFPLPDAERVGPGDSVILSGAPGAHGIAVLAAREKLVIADSIQTDLKFLHPLCASLYPLGEGLRFMRDATRGGVASVLNELALSAGLGVEITEDRVPAVGEVCAAADLLGLDTLEIANEGLFVAIVAQEVEASALSALRSLPGGENAAAVGRITANHPGTVIIETAVRGRRILGFPRGLLLPRIC